MLQSKHADVPVLEEAPVLRAEEFEQFMASVGQQSTGGGQPGVGEKVEQQGKAEGTLAGKIKILCECSPLTCDEGEPAWTQPFSIQSLSRNRVG